MTVGDRTFKGLAVPLSGEFELKQETLGTDFMTMTGVTSQTADFIVCRNSSLTEKFVVDKDGVVTAAGGYGAIVGTGATLSGDVIISGANAVNFSSVPTTAATTGITKGDIFVMETSTFVQLAIGQTANALRYVNTTSA